MQNKTLARILKKSLKISTLDELRALLDQIRGQRSTPDWDTLCHDFTDSLLSLVANVDKAFADLERVIDIRDRSLSISSREMTVLNDEISAQAQKQKAVLQQLQSMLRLLRNGEPEENAEKADMEELIANVDRLIKSHVQSAKTLLVLFEEGLKIASALSFKALEVQLQSSVRQVTGLKAQVRIFFAGHLFADPDLDPIAFFSCDERNRPKDRLAELGPETLRKSLFLNINSLKASGTLATVEIFIPDTHSSEDVLAGVQPVLPNVAATLENIRLMQEEKRKQHLENELMTARFVQQTLLPATAAKVTPEIEVSGYYQSASECGGDWWNYYQDMRGRHIIMVGDVTGHGTASAMVCAVVKGYCDSFRTREAVDLDIMLKELNQVMLGLSREGHRAMTMAIVAIDAARNVVQFANAGHPHPIHFSLQKGGTRYLVSSGPLLGLDENPKYSVRSFPFMPGEQIVFYSDGVIECMDRSSHMYGERRLRAVVKAQDADTTALALNRAIVQDLQRFYSGGQPMDDITTVVVKNVAYNLSQ